MSRQDMSSIEHEIDSTRHRIDQRLDALFNRISATHLLGDALEGVRENGSQFASNLMHTARDNPVATTMAAAGLAWLMVSDRNRRHHAGSYPLPVPVEQASPSPDMRVAAGEAAHAAGGAAHAVGDKARGAADAARSATSRAGAAVGSAAGAARSGAHDLGARAGAAASSAAEAARSGAHEIGARAGRAQHAAAQMTSDAYRSASDMTRRAGSFLADNPLMIGALGLAIGGILAAALPRTHREDELMGEAGDKVRDDVKATAGEVAREGEKMATSVVQAAKEEAKEQVKRQDARVEARMESAGKKAHEGDTKKAHEGDAKKTAAPEGDAKKTAHEGDAKKTEAEAKKPMQGEVLPPTGRPAGEEARRRTGNGAGLAE